jgi:hypothetical protein
MARHGGNQQAAHLYIHLMENHVDIGVIFTSRGVSDATSVNSVSSFVNLDAI